MSLGDALADVMLEGRAAGAESAASWARADASRARSAQADAESDAYKQKMLTQAWKEHAKKLEQVLAERTALTSAGFIIINAVIKTMETLPPAQRESFRDHVAQLSRARMQKLDGERGNGPNHVSIESSFRSESENAILKIV